MELEISGEVFRIQHNAYDFKNGDGERIVGTSHVVTLLDFGSGERGSDEGRKVTFVKVPEEALEGYKVDEHVRANVSVRGRANGSTEIKHVSFAAPVASVKSA